MQLKPLENQNSRRMKPLPRITRTVTHHIEEGDGHLWAVSYADLLMVLMSFFIIFFSFSDTNPEKDGMLKLALSFQEVNKSDTPPSSTNLSMLTALGLGLGLEKRSSGQDMGKIPGKVLNTIAFKNLGALVTEEGKYLFIQMPDNIFLPRQFALDKKTETALAVVYNVLKEHKNNLEVIVIGHSDSTQVSGKTSQYLSNNFDLSSLRALRALQFLIKEGFPESNISAQGSADGMRSSRSLSIRVQLKETST